VVNKKIKEGLSEGNTATGLPLWFSSLASFNVESLPHPEAASVKIRAKQSTNRLCNFFNRDLLSRIPTLFSCYVIFYIFFNLSFIIIDKGNTYTINRLIKG
jgi:hypothetical protein